MIRRPPRSTHCISSAASDVYKRQEYMGKIMVKPMQQDINIYLKYADMFDSANSVIAQYCRMYYLEEKINEAKNSNSANFKSPTESVFFQSIFNKAEKARARTGYSAPQRKEVIENYLLDMYRRLVSSLLSPKCDKEGCRRRLLNLIDLILILTSFGPLNPEWTGICKVEVKVRWRV
eukprot:TRINITY_DN9739_c0_g1_i6.p2 TRINITY_DN9739_c0_g1~~TRINITY_DN9739_c0_g1_i6.p2  ORF type:complete len:186 (+),score=60.63 TRINITY_DN9739_c0_g1_i6:30-560(+)